ncbi:hypothetical protein NVP1293O_28 [Vibrio phage 1.293.O._10N.261.52.E1]|nr:hypothetical protein NVP1293O_28 [Vibrio phage 1.293.O._10N.261.52.E1]
MEELVERLMSKLLTEHHPHHTLVITSTRAELLEGKCSVVMKETKEC